MKPFSFTKIAPLLVFSLFAVSSATQRSMTVSGTVVDSVSNQPIPNAMVLLYDSLGIPNLNNVNSFSFDTVFTGSNGTFSYAMKVGTTANIMFYVVLKEMYSPKINYKTLTATTTSIALGTIQLVPSDLGAKDTVVVSGTVVDSATGEGIAGALVGLMGGDLDTAGKTVVTGAAGAFSKEIIVNTVTIVLAGTFTFVEYIVVKDGYAPATGIKTASGKTVDLGSIRLIPSTSIRWKGLQRVPYSSHATGMSVYSLNGRLLYTGPITSPDHIARQSPGAVLVNLRRNGLSVGKEKIIPVR